jgi:hydroxylamine reductase
MHVVRHALRRALLRGGAPPPAAVITLRPSVVASSSLYLQPTASMLSSAAATAHATAEMATTSPDMFCRQCEQTANHHACLTVGVCGKTSETASGQDALIQQIKSVSHWVNAATNEGVPFAQLEPVHTWTLGATFSTLTNVNFSTERIVDFIQQGEAHKKLLKDLVKSPPTNDSAGLDLTNKTIEEIEEYGYSVSVPKRSETMGHLDAFSLNEIATYGLKGACAYAMHCVQLGSVNEAVMNTIQQIWSKLDSSQGDVNGLLATAMKVGETNATILGMLDEAHANNFGVPEPTQVRSTAVEGKCILISGHDMMDLYELLRQTEGTGVKVWTHGEMLPGHSYPKLKAFSHLAGNYGTAWQNQVRSLGLDFIGDCVPATTSGSLTFVPSRCPPSEI